MTRIKSNSSKNYKKNAGKFLLNSNNHNNINNNFEQREIKILQKYFIVSTCSEKNSICVWNIQESILTSQYLWVILIFLEASKAVKNKSICFDCECKKDLDI